MSRRVTTKMGSYDDFVARVDKSGMTSESKQIFKLMVKLFKSITNERDSKITSLEQKVEDNRIKSETQIESMEATINKLSEDLKTAHSANHKLNIELFKSKKSQDDLEAYSRRENLVFSGDVVKPAQPNENCAIIVRDIIKNTLQIPNEPLISTAHRIGKPPVADSAEPDKRAIIVKLVRRDDKFLIMKTAKDKKIQGLYINESLTPTRSKILNVLRQCRKIKNGPVRGASTLNGKVFVYTKPAPNAPDDAASIRTEINTEEHLAEFCCNFIKKPLELFLDKQGRRIF